MSKIVPLTFLTLLLATGTVATADVTVVATTKVSGMGQNQEGETVSKIRGLMNRTETQGGKNDTVTLLDLEAKKMMVLDPKKKRAEVYDMAPAAQQQAQLETQEISLEPTGTTRQTAGYSCQDHRLKARIEAGMASAPGMTVQVVMTGVVCLAPEAPGREESAAFYQGMAERGLFLGNPEAAQAQPGRERGLTEMYRKMAEKGVPLISDIEIGFEGEGPMAAMLGRLKVETSTTVKSISTESLPDQDFVIPSDYKIKKR